ncbi:MAG: hypothetical protein ACLP01_06555 [Solirubrobacteraceae bacterium]
MPATPGALGRCVLPGHLHDASFEWIAESGLFRYVCEWAPEGGYTLPELRAIIGYAPTVTGSSRFGAAAAPFVPPRGEMARWRELLDLEAGLIGAKPVPIIAPASLSVHARNVADDIAMLLGVRDARWRRLPFIYPARFCAARAGLTVGEAREALNELLGAGVIVRRRRTNGKLRGYDLGVPPGSTVDAIVALIVHQFDAVELTPMTEATA